VRTQRRARVGAWRGAELCAQIGAEGRTCLECQTGRRRIGRVEVRDVVAQEPRWLTWATRRRCWRCARRSSTRGHGSGSRLKRSLPEPRIRPTSKSRSQVFDERASHPSPLANEPARAAVCCGRAVCRASAAAETRPDKMHPGRNTA